MRTTCNPGRALEVTGSFDFGPTLAERDLVATPSRGFVRDRESGQRVTLEQLLASFMADPADGVTGPIRILIEAAP